MSSGLHFSAIHQEVGDDCFSVQMGVAQDGVFEGSQIILWHAVKEVGVAGVDASSVGCVIPELHLKVGIAAGHFSRVVSSLPLDKLGGRVGVGPGSGWGYLIVVIHQGNWDPLVAIGSIASAGENGQAVCLHDPDDDFEKGIVGFLGGLGEWLEAGPDVGDAKSELHGCLVLKIQI